MSALKFKALSGDAYEVHRDGVWLGCVERVKEARTTVRATRARLTTSVRWRFQVVGQQPHPTLSLTRQKAAQALAIHFDAHRIEKAQTKKGGAL